MCAVKLSIVTTLYRSAPYIEEFHRRASSAARRFAGEDYEIIMVNDGSPDESLEVALALVEHDPHVKVADLSRNFGHHKAMMTGLRYATGGLVFLLDSDLEEEPEWLLSFADQLETKKYDVVYGVQKERKGAIFERVSGDIYYRVINLLCNIEHPRNITTARLMRHEYVNALLQHQEREMIFSCLCVITGFKQASQVVTKHSTSPSTYTLIKKLALAVTVITSFSDYPLRIIFWIGAIIFTGSIGYGLYLAAQKFFWAQPMDGWTSIMVSIWILGGLVISLLGVIGAYLAKIFTETKQRPLTIVREVYDGSARKKY